MKKLLVLGGTRMSCEIIRKAQELGYFVGVADYNSIEKSPGKQIADENYLVSCTDVERVVQLIRAEKFDGVLVGFSDKLLPYYAEICEKAQLPSYATKEQFNIFINKNRYKALCRNFGIPTVDEYLVDINNFDESIKNIDFPVMVKPADSSGSRGITVCNNREELRRALEKAYNFTDTGEILVEKYLSGKEVTVFWLFQDGQYYLTGVANRHVKSNQEGVIPLPVGYTYPSILLPKYQSSIEDKAKEMFRAVGIKNGMMFMQCKVVADECIVYDIGYRLTGSLEFKNFKAVSNYDPLELLINFALTGKMGEDVSRKVDPQYGGKYPFNVSCLAKPGTIQKILGIENVKKMPEVIDVYVSHMLGETITEEMRGLLSQITIRVLGTADSKEKLYETMKRIEEELHIISTDGEEMRLSGIEPEDIKNVL